MAFGYCKLTGKRGTFVSSHLLPKAVTRPSKPGSPFIEAKVGLRPVRRFDSWYDKELVIRLGEDILSEYDDQGIAELRRHGLLWSGRPFDVVPDVMPLSEEQGSGLREINGVDGHKLRMFFLSLLWRAAASQRREFAQVTIAKDQLEQLRLMVLNGIAEPVSFYPVWLTQLLEVGEPHNHVPTATTMHVASSEGKSGEDVPLFRFYFDGLIANFYRPETNRKELLEPNVTHVGGDMLLIMTQQTQLSHQYENLRTVVGDALTNWPELMAKL